MSLLSSNLCQFKHGFQGRLILHKIVFYISIVSQISQTLNRPLPCFGINLGIAEPPESRKNGDQLQSPLIFMDINLLDYFSHILYNLCVYLLPALLGQLLCGAFSKLS